MNLPQTGFPAELTHHTECHIVNDTFVKTRMSTVAKDVPSGIVDMNMFVTIVHIIQQPVTLIIRPYFARIIPVNTQGQSSNKNIVPLTYVVPFCAKEDTTN